MFAEYSKLDKANRMTRAYYEYDLDALHRLWWVEEDLETPVSGDMIARIKAVS